MSNKDRDILSLPVRRSARALLINEEKKVLLQKFKLLNVVDEKLLWVTPGGRLENKESYKQALARELEEELSLTNLRINRPVFYDSVLVHGKKGDFVSHEVYYALPVKSSIYLDTSGMTQLEQDTLYDMKWWSAEELEKADNKSFTPYKMIAFLKNYKYPH